MMRWNPFDHDADPTHAPQAPRTRVPVIDDEAELVATEERVRTILRARGWHVTKRGWPDFFCLDAAGRVMAIEVKGPKDHLSRYQVRCLEALERHGIRCQIAHVAADGSVKFVAFAAHRSAPVRRPRVRPMPRSWGTPAR